MAFQQFFENHFTWIEGFMRNVRRYANKPAMICPDVDRTWTYSELNSDVNRLCNAFATDDLKKGDVIMLLMPNCPEFAISYIAAHKMHAVCCPVNYRLSCGELGFLLDDSKPAILIFDETYRALALEAVKHSLNKPRKLIAVGGTSDNAIVSFDDYAGNCTDDEPAYTCDYNIYDETLRFYTSGTTGRPKGVPLTSINEVMSAHDTMIQYSISSKDVTMNATPWFHRGGMHCTGPGPCFYAGATIVVMGKFTPDITLKNVIKYKVSYIVGVPALFEDLADKQEQKGYDLSCLRGIISMGSPLERAACLRFQKVLSPNVFNGYGTTEMHFATILRPFDLPDYSGAAGTSCVDDDVRVVKIYDDRRAEPDDLLPCDNMEVGEVIISSPNQSSYQYFNNSEATESKFYKGFFYTSDLATWDENGFLTILGRKDDMIISAGENIYPVEVETVLKKHPKVKDSIVTAVPDKVNGQTVTAYVVRNDDSLTPEELDDFCKDSPDLANFKRPRYYRFVSQIPTNAMNKKQHFIIKETAFLDLKNGLLYKV